jgi:hypothetical protein
MAFTEFSAPVQYEYKPLNLSAFMVPLAKMQEQYDAVEAAVSSSTVDLESLNWGTDKERAKDLKETYGQKVTELAKNLAETKNYKQAAIKLKELQNTWLKDPEKNALESNYKLVQQAVKEQKERIGKSLANNGITQGQYDQWYRDLKDRYEGLGGADFKASYEDPEGKYNIAERTARLADMTEELEKVKFEAAKAVPGQTVEGVLQSAGYDTETMDKKFMKTTIDEKNRDVIAQRVVDYVSQLPRFTPWLKEVEYYDFKDLKQDPERFQEAASSLNTRYINSLNQQIQGLEGAAKKNPKLLETQDYKDLLEDRDAAVKAQKSGEYDPNVIASLYAVDYENKMYNADALGALLAYKNVKRDYDWRKLHIPDDGGSGDGTTKADQDAYWIPNTEEISITSLNGKKIQAGTQLINANGNINNLAGGAVRNVVMGSKGSKMYEELKTNPDLVRARQKNLLEVITKTIEAGGDIKTLKRLANQKGIHIPEAEANNIKRTFFTKGNQAIADFKKELENTRGAEVQYEESETMMQNIRKSVESNKDFQKEIYDIGQKSFTSSVVLSSKGGFSDEQLEKQRQLFLPKSYSADQYKKAGIKQPGMISGYLTFNQVAKLNGYKSFSDAVNKGFNFKGAYLEVVGGKPVNAKNYYDLKTAEFYGKKQEKSDMGFRYVNNKDLDKQLSKWFLSADELKSYKPAFAKNWNSVDGFTENDTDLKLNITENRSPKLIVIGNKVLYELPISYKRDGVAKDGTIQVEPKEGMGVRHEQILTDARLATRNRETEATRETDDMLQVARFNNKFRDNILTPQNVKAVNATKGGAAMQIYSVPFDGRTKLQVEKVHSGGTNPVLKIAVVDVNTGKKTGYINNPETNRPWYVNAESNEAAYAAKAMMMRVLGE